MMAAWRGATRSTRPRTGSTRRSRDEARSGVGARESRRRGTWPRTGALAAIGVGLALACTASDPSRTSLQPPSSSVQPSPTPSSVRAHRSQIDLARRRIDHVIFIVKENRTFDHLFGRFPGSDGATTAITCDGTVVPLERATDRSPGTNHRSSPDPAINGGKMDCFDRLQVGEAPRSFVQYHRDQIPS